MTKTIVIGGGLLGLCSAYALLERGHEIDLLESREGVGLETSFANGGILTPSMADPWNSPGVHKHLIGSLFNPNSAIKLSVPALPSLLFWGSKFLKYSASRHHLAASQANFLLASYSVQLIRRLRERLDLNYNASTVGTIKVFRDKDSMLVSRRIAEELKPSGLSFVELDTQGTLEVEPQLFSIRDKIVGSLFFPDDESGDAHLFCKALSHQIEAAGGKINTNVTVKRLLIQKGRVYGVETNQGMKEGERIIVAAGITSTALLKKCAINLSVRPAKGYSVTINMESLDELLPKIPVVDDAMHAAVTPLGKRLRVVGTAEFCGLDNKINQSRIDNLFNLLASLYPKLANQIDRSTTIPWAGLRPMSADGMPYIGESGIKGLFLNTGHGHLGWTMAAGSAAVMADLIEGKRPAIEVGAFSARRR